VPDVIRLGVAGLGLGSARVVPELARLDFLKLTAAADIRRSAAEHFAREFNAEAYVSVAEMCQSPNIDAVYVATPNQFHAEHTITALEAGKHVVVEKPMAVSIEQCEAMNAAAKANGVVLLCGHTHSLDAPLQKMAEIIQSGELGRPLMVYTTFYKNFIYRPFSDEQIASHHGVVLEQLPHQADIVRLLGGGLVRSVRARTGIGDPSRPAEGHYVCYLEFENGLPAMMVFSGYAYFDSAELVWGIGEGGAQVDPESFIAAHRYWREIAAGEERDRIVAERIESWQYGGAHAGEWFFQGRTGPPKGESHQPFFGLTIVSCEQGDMRQSPDGLYLYTAAGWKEISVARRPFGPAAEMRELYDAVVNKQQPLRDGRWGAATLEVAFAALESAATGSEVTLSHQVPLPPHAVRAGI